MFQPHYHVSAPLLATLKRIAIQVHELNKQRPVAEATAALQEEALALSAAAAAGGDALPLPEVRRLLQARPQAAGPDEGAILRYGRALSDFLTTPAADLDLALLLRIHYRLSRGVLPDEQRGRLRREAAPARRPGSAGLSYWPPDPQTVPVLLRELLAFGQKNWATLDPVLLAGLFHKQLLLIRPFASGNEQVAWLATRLLLSAMGLKTFNLLAVERGVLADPAAYSATIGARGNYYALAGSLDFTPWLAYFAEGVSAELAALEERLRQRQASPATALRTHHLALLAYIDEHGFITDKQYARFTDRAKATRSLDFKKLLELGLLAREGRGRATFYRRKP